MWPQARPRSAAFGIRLRLAWTLRDEAVLCPGTLTLSARLRQHRQTASGRYLSFAVSRRLTFPGLLLRQ